jgi:hypothetical protein
MLRHGHDNSGAGDVGEVGAGILICKATQCRPTEPESGLAPAVHRTHPANIHDPPFQLTNWQLALSGQLTFATNAVQAASDLIFEMSDGRKRNYRSSSSIFFLFISLSLVVQMCSRDPDGEYNICGEFEWESHRPLSRTWTDFSGRPLNLDRGWRLRL